MPVSSSSGNTCSYSSGSCPCFSTRLASYPKWTRAPGDFSFFRDSLVQPSAQFFVPCQDREPPKVDAAPWGFLIFSGFAGSAVGTIFFTLALKEGNPTVVNVI